MESLASLLSAELNARVTKIFGRSESSVRMVISRHQMAPMDRPERKVMYRFGWFSEHSSSHLGGEC